jgi:hypothetical protein
MLLKVELKCGIYLLICPRTRVSNSINPLYEEQDTFPRRQPCAPGVSLVTIFLDVNIYLNISYYHATILWLTEKVTY